MGCARGHVPSQYVLGGIDEVRTHNIWRSEGSDESFEMLKWCLDFFETVVDKVEGSRVWFSKSWRTC